MDLFFDPDIEQNNFVLNNIESKHCINVLRKKVGDKISVTDGKGNLFVSEIITASPKGCSINVIDKVIHQQQNPHIHIAIAPTKNMDRFEWFLEKATEIGVSEITPLLCNHSERRKLRLERCEKVVISAMKQSLKFHKPIVNDLISFKNFISNKSIQSAKYIAHCEDDKEKKLLRDVYKLHSDSVILIGPEGDFSKEEIETALSNNYTPISLGENRLRTETAGVMACATFALLNE